MKIMKKHILLALTTMALPISAQNITFDSDDFKAVSVYDAWEDSPFRTDRLCGNVAVVSNHLNQVDEVLGEAPNETSHILALQRSRYGSNRFGVRVDLKEPFRLTKNRRYLHVMIHKPVESRVMVIGLGKRTEEAWSWQDGECEQFHAVTIQRIPADAWADAVVSFNGFSYADADKDGIDIHSLVIVPDVRSTHADATDFVCYVDEITVNDDAQPRFTTEKYAVSFDRDSAPARADRYMTAVGLKGGTFSSQTHNLSLDRNYYDLTSTTVFSAKAGDTLTPTYGYTGAWMSTFTYLDFANDGKFSYDINADGTPAPGSDIVSYQFTDATGSNTNSLGASVTNGNQIGNPSPSFTLPPDMSCGFYRMRYKVDWASLDPAGNPSPNNLILNNGGGIVDVMLDVHAPQLRVSQGALNGEVLDADGNSLDNCTAPYGQTFTIRMSPAPGFGHLGVRVRSGYHVAGAQTDRNGNPQYIVTEFPYTLFNADGSFTLPAAVMIGEEVSIEGLFVEESLVPDPDAPGEQEATFPCVSPMPADGEWAEGTVAYHIRNGAVENAWVSTQYTDADGNLMLNNGVEPLNAEGAWIVCGNDADGYRFYNLAAGPQYVLGITGSEASARARLYPIHEVTADGVVTRFDWHENGAGFSFRLHGSQHNCFNSRNRYFALWNASDAFSSDNGSRFTFFEVEDLKVGVEYPTVETPTDDAVLYDLHGRRVALPGRGITLSRGRKTIR